MILSNKKIKTRITLIVSSVLFFSAAFFLVSRLGTASAYTLGAPHWVEMPSNNYYEANHWPAGCRGPDDWPCWDAFDTCDPFTWYPVSYFGYPVFRYKYGYSDSACTIGPTTVDLYVKEAMCPAGEVMVGTRFHEWYKSVDQEHEDALCAPISGVTFGASRWVSASNAMSKISNAYKTVSCFPGEVMTGIRMFGIQEEVDDEHVDAYCTSVTGVSVGGAYNWVEAPNAWATLTNSYKTALCSPGQVMVGARWFQIPIDIDDEHTDAQCYTPPPSVKVWFGS